MSSQDQLPNLDRIFRDDDEPDFAPSGGSNLAAIFGLQQKLTDSHSSKQSTAPIKDTQYNAQQTASSAKTEVLIAKAVHAFQLKNGEYTSVGKLGIALTGNAASKTYELILYRTKQKYVSVARITSDFVFTVQANNYATYYDTVNNTGNNWSVLFDSNDSYVEFAIEVGLARYFVTRDRGENVIYQDLQPGSKGVIVNEGDNVHLKYFVGTEIAQPFKNNSNPMMSQMTVEISPDDNWERTLLGCSKGLKRVLFVPPGKQISLGPGFPKERYIMLIIEIIDVRTSEANPLASKTSSGRAAIISRMAKMGQSILPKMPLPSTTDSEDTEDDIPHKSPRYKRIEQPEGGLPKKILPRDPLEERKVVQKIIETRSEIPSVDSNAHQSLVAAPLSTQQIWTSPYLAATVNRTIPTAVDPLNMLLSETRITNAEIRMGMSKISDNIQKLLDKFHALELQNATTPTASDKATLDASLKMILALNASQMNARNNESPKSTDKDTLDENLRESQNRINVLENDLKKVKEEKESLLQANADLSKELRELEANLSKTNDELKKTKETLEVALNTMKQYKDENINLQNRLCKCERDHTRQADEMFKQSDIERKNKEIKQIMNRTYHALSEKFTNQSRSELPLDYVKSTIAKTIKHTTLQVLYKDPDEENKKSEEYVHSAVGKSNDNQQTENNTERPQGTSASGDLSIKCIPSSVSTIAPMYENEPPPVPFEGTDEVDSE